jgi:hypothetical protein
MSEGHPRDHSGQPDQEPELRYSTPPPESSTPVPAQVWSPPVANERPDVALMAAFLVVASIILIPPGIAFFLTSHSPLLARIPGLMVYFLPTFLTITGAILLVKQGRQWDGVNQRRQLAAAWGLASGIPPATPQPFPSAASLPEPFVLKVKTNWLAVVALPFLAVGLLFLVWAYFALSFGLLLGFPVQESLQPSLGLWAFALAVTLIVIVNVTRLAWSPERIEITSAGLSVTPAGSVWRQRSRPNRTSNLTRRIAWEEARLFALRSGKPGAAKLRYELSSPATEVTFRRIVRPHAWSLYHPAQPFDQYSAQMDALLSAISAHTGLPLYDVRQLPRADSVPAPRWSRNYSITLSALLFGLSFACQLEGVPGVLLAAQNDGRPVVLALEIIACLSALAGLGFGYSAYVLASRSRLLLLGYLLLALAIIGLALFPLGPLIH